MTTYQYTAISLNGEKVTGVVEAVDEYAAVSQIKETCSTIVKISEVKQGAKEPELFRPKLKEKNLAVMCSQFATILEAGLPVNRAIRLITDQTTEKSLRQTLRETADDVGSGISLAHAFERRKGIFPIAFIETVRFGEESGTLETAFRRLDRYYNKSAKTKGKARAAMTYPAFTLVIAVLVVALIMIKAVPTFVSSFQQMAMELPLPTVILIAVSNFFTRWWVVMLVVILVFLLFWKLWGCTENGALIQSRIRLKMPVLGKLRLQRLSGQFAATMSTLLAAGIPLIRAVESTAQVLDNALICKELNTQLPRLTEGKTLASCLKNCPFLPELLVEMTSIGEETGTLERTLETVSDYYDNEADLLSQKIISLLEPIIICVLAIIVVLILLAVYLPMFSLYSAF